MSATAKKTTTKKSAKKAEPKYVVANDTFFVGGRTMVEVGQVYDASHDLPKRYPTKFDPVSKTAVEAATAEPGQLRNVTIPQG